MRLSILASEIPTEKTHIRAGDHHQIWLGTPEITLMFETDAEMLAFATDLYGKVLAAMPDEVVMQVPGPELKEYEFDAGLGNPKLSD